MALHAFTSAPLWLAMAGVVVAYYCYMVNPRVPAWFKEKFSSSTPAGQQVLHGQVQRSRLRRRCPPAGQRPVDRGRPWLIDGLFVNGSAKVVGWFSTFTRLWQSGYIYHYAFVMIIGCWVSWCGSCRSRSPNKLSE
jgi:NADH-quinone oxidoreductase subunit L